MTNAKLNQNTPYFHCAIPKCKERKNLSKYNWKNYQTNSRKESEM